MKCDFCKLLIAIIMKLLIRSLKIKKINYIFNDVLLEPTFYTKFQS